MNSLFIFRRDLRLDDNTGLIKACNESSQVYPIFIINQLQVSDKNSYKSENAIQFMHESLKELKDLSDNKISFFLADDDKHKETKILIDLVKKLKIDKVYSNKDYTSYARKRDNEIKDILDKEKVEFVPTEDYTLTGLDEIKTNSDTFYTKYTPYKNKAKQIKVNEPVNFTKGMKNKLSKISSSISSQSIDVDILEEKYYDKNVNLNVNRIPETFNEHNNIVDIIENKQSNQKLFGSSRVLTEEEKQLRIRSLELNSGGGFSSGGGGIIIISSSSSICTPSMNSLQSIL